jgi:hypothetical protein
LMLVDQSKPKKWVPLPVNVVTQSSA